MRTLRAERARASLREQVSAAARNIDARLDEKQERGCRARGLVKRLLDSRLALLDEPLAGGYTLSPMLDATTAVRLTHVEQTPLNQRWLVTLADGGQVECVLYRGHTLCVSSQVGCAVRCPFCASGARGLARPLALAEMIGQVEAVREAGHAFERVTVSGVGDPLHNHDVVQAFVTYCHSVGLGPSLTTSGGPLPRLREWLHAPHNGLTLSVHAGTEAVRAQMVPKAPGLDELFGLVQAELPRMTQRRRRKTALAYLLVDGMNEAQSEIDAFIERTRALGLAIHLYAYNPVPTGPFRRVPEARYRAIYAHMTSAGLRVRMSSQARIEGNGGCGTLVALHRKLEPTARA